MTGIIIAVAAALITGGIVGYVVFRYIINGKYNQLMEAAKKGRRRHQREKTA